MFKVLAVFLILFMGLLSSGIYLEVFTGIGIRFTGKKIAVIILELILYRAAVFLPDNEVFESILAVILITSVFFIMLHGVDSVRKYVTGFIKLSLILAEEFLFVVIGYFLSFLLMKDGYSFSGNGVNETQLFVSMLVASTAASLIPGLYLYLKYMRKHSYLLFRKREIIINIFYVFYLGLATFMVVSFMLSMGKQWNEIEFVTVRLSLFSLLTFSVIIIPLYIFRTLERDRLTSLARKQESFLESQLKAASSYRDSQEETRAFRHDIKNNLQVLLLMLYNGQDKEAIEYLEDMSGKLSSLTPKVITGDDMLDALVALKLKEMESKHIKFNIKGVIDGGIGWSPMDICAVFANALDNAIEAAAKVEEDKRFIDINIKKTDHNRLIEISNSCDGNVDTGAITGNGKNATSKKDKADHGYGTHNMINVAEKNNAIINFSCEDKKFTVTLISNRK